MKKLNFYKKSPQYSNKTLYEVCKQGQRKKKLIIPTRRRTRTRTTRLTTSWPSGGRRQRHHNAYVLCFNIARKTRLQTTDFAWIDWYFNLADNLVKLGFVLLIDFAWQIKYCKYLLGFRPIDLMEGARDYITFAGGVLILKGQR